MPKVIVEMQKLRVPESGLGQFCTHLGRELARLERGSLELEFFVPPSRLGCFGEAVEYRRRQPWHRWLGVAAQGCQVWHSVHQDSPYRPVHSRARILLTIHDLNFLAKWQGDQAAIDRRLRRLQKRVDRAALVVTCSHYVANVVRSHLRCRAPIEVVYEAPCLETDLAPERPASVPPGEFLLALGQVNRKKNLHVLLPLLAPEPQSTLVLAGVDDNVYGQEIRRQAAALGVRERVVFTGPVSEAQKLWLYQNCRALLFPSLAEGFGLPVIEAMSQGKPVFLSRAGSLPEIGGAEAYYWDDFAPESLVATFRAGMERFGNDPDKPGRLRAWAGQFSWQRTAEQYLKLYSLLAQQS
jgi:glycosyltransferase involved in cell wall biosynthesis